MNNTATKIFAEQSNIGIDSIHFVQRFSPFVGSLKNSFIPFICINRPPSHFKPVSSRNRGFTMIELVVTMVVAALVVAIAIPNITDLIRSGRINTQLNGLKADFNFARSEAIKHRKNVIVCQSSNGTSCIGTAGDWKDGRLIYVDKNSDGAIDADEILRYREAVGRDDRSLQVADAVAAAVASVTFTSNGGTTGVTNFTICDGEGPTKGKRLSLRFTGLATTLPAAPTSCN